MGLERTTSGRDFLQICLRVSAVFFALGVVSCVPSVVVKTAHDPSAPFDEYRTFAMIEPNRPIHSSNTEVDPFVMQRIRQLAYLRLKEAGLRPVAKKRADLLVGVAAGTDEQLHVYTTRFRDPFYDPFYYPAFSSTQVMRVREGVIVVDLIDREENGVVWRGTGSRATGNGWREEHLREIVGEILGRFPRSRQAE